MNGDEIDIVTYIQDEIKASGYSTEVASDYCRYALWRKNVTHTLKSLEDYERRLIKQYPQLTYGQHLSLRDLSLDAMAEYLLRA